MTTKEDIDNHLGRKMFGEGTFQPPSTPRMVEKGDSSTPVSEDLVTEETDGIFRSFVQNMHANQSLTDEADETPTFSELAFGGSQTGPFSHYSDVGRRLAQIGDSINSRYTPEFNSMIKTLNPNVDNISQILAAVGNHLFFDNKIHWGRIITFLCFGYNLAITVLKKGLGGMFSSIITSLISYLLKKKICEWIAQRGGWIAVLKLVPEMAGWFGVAIVVACGVVTAAAAIYNGGIK